MRIFDYNHYKKYLLAVLKMRGLRKQLAARLRCDPSFVSRILNGDGDFNLEQADAINRFLNHSKLESQYFVGLVNLARAGTSSLRAYFRSELEELKLRHQNLHYRYSESKEEVPQEVASQYYSSWLYAAVDSLLTSNIVSREDEIAARLGVGQEKVRAVIQDLLQWGLIRSAGPGKFEGAKHIHLAADSPDILKHHVNWRLHALRSLECIERDDFHYSSLVTLSYEDIEKVRKHCLDAVEQVVATVKSSPPEDGYVLCLDFSRL